MNISNIPIGGTGVTARRLYRDKNGANSYHRVVEISDNTTTTYVDNIADTAVAVSPGVPTIDTSVLTQVDAIAVLPGLDGNAVAGSINVLTNAPLQLTSVINPQAFTGGTDIEDTETYRQRLLDFIQNPDTGSPADIKSWAESVDGVETATVTENKPTAGTVEVSITGPGGTIPSASVISATQATLDAQSYANITINVVTFTQLSTPVTVSVKVDPAFTLAGVTPSVQSAISNYINNLQVAETLMVAGIVDSVFGLQGILDVTVTTPASNQTTPAGQKRIPGTITVNALP